MAKAGKIKKKFEGSRAPYRLKKPLGLFPKKPKTRGPLGLKNFQKKTFFNIGGPFLPPKKNPKWFKKKKKVVNKNWGFPPPPFNKSKTVSPN